MRAVLICFLMLATATLPATARQEKPEKPKGPPKKGEPISVRGCLAGSALEATELGFQDPAAGLSSAVTFQLKGDKALLKEMRDKFEGKIVEIQGILKSDLPQENAQSRKVGKVRITIGTPATNPGSLEAEGRRSLPVLEAKSYEGSITVCR